jgi:hypothetical protein
VEDGLEGPRSRAGGRVAVTVALLESDGDLDEDLPDEFLVDRRPLLLRALDDGAEIAALALLHHDLEAHRGLVDDAVLVAHDEGVAEVAEDVHLRARGWVGVGGWVGSG